MTDCDGLKLYDIGARYAADNTDYVTAGLSKAQVAAYISVLEQDPAGEDGDERTVLLSASKCRLLAAHLVALANELENDHAKS